MCFTYVWEGINWLRGIPINGVFCVYLVLSRISKTMKSIRITALAAALLMTGGQHRQRSQRNSDHRGSHSSRMGLFLKKENLSLYPNLDQDLIKKAQNAQLNEFFCIFAWYEQEGIHICPTLGGALEAIPSQLQLTISVCLAVRIPIDFPQSEGNPQNISLILN